MHIDHSPADAGVKWPLVILNSTGGWSELYLKNGEMVFYESARMIHGRPHPYTGDRYAQLYAHFRPVAGWVGNPNVKHWGQPGAHHAASPSTGAKKGTERQETSEAAGALEENVEEGVPITITNERNAPVDLYWEGQLMAQLGAGDTMHQDSYRGHVFVAKSIDGNYDLGTFVAGEVSHFVIAAQREEL